MTKDEIIELAEKFGIPEFENHESQADNIVRFAELVAAREREACAKVCDELSDKHTWEGSYADECAQAIRARGEQA